MRTRPTTPLFVSGAPIELGDQHQPSALGRREVPGQLGDLGLEALQRHRFRHDEIPYLHNEPSFRPQGRSEQVFA
jgi:hypothetical protein